MEQDDDINCNWCAQYSHQKINARTEGLGNKMTSGDHPKYSIKIGQNTEKSPGDSRELAITQTPVENHQTNADLKIFSSILLTII